MQLLRPDLVSEKSHLELVSDFRKYMKAQVLTWKELQDILRQSCPLGTGQCYSMLDAKD